jgi:hypothetical protein
MRAFLALLAGLTVLAGVLIVRFGGPGATPAPASAKRAVAHGPMARVSPEARPRRLPGREPAAPVAGEGGGIAHLRGRIVGAGGTPCADCKLVVDGGTRVLGARSDDAGAFVIHLVPGVYTLTAHDGELVGRLEGVRAAGGRTREVTLQLGPGAAIAGRVKRRGDVSIGILWLSPNGRADERLRREVEVGDDGTFSVAGLIPGARYDLFVDQAGLRPSAVRDVAAPTTGLDLEVEASPSLAGAIGLVAGDRCPVNEVIISGAGNDDGVGEPSRTVSIDEPCHFTAPALPWSGAILVQANGDGWHLEQTVQLPEHGDPEPLCLNPPCQATAPTTLVIALDGAHEGMTALATAGGTSSGGCGTSGGSSCSMSDLAPPGGTVQVEASSADCSRAVGTIVLHAGANAITLPCVRPRLIQGVLRLPASAEAPALLRVRCPGGEQSLVERSFVFDLRCPADARAIEWALGRREPWRTLPLAGSGNPLLVELALP